MNKKTLWISVSGLDGAGKTTLVDTTQMTTDEVFQFVKSKLEQLNLFWQILPTSNEVGICHF